METDIFDYNLIINNCITQNTDLNSLIFSKSGSYLYPSVSKYKLAGVCVWVHDTDFMNVHIAHRHPSPAFSTKLSSLFMLL